MKLICVVNLLLRQYLCMQPVKFPCMVKVFLFFMSQFITFEQTLMIELCRGTDSFLYYYELNVLQMSRFKRFTYVQ